MRKKIRRVDIPAGRCYILESEGNYKYLPSVTSILSMMDKSHLIKLEAEIGKEEFAKISERAALRGTAMHLFMENFLICMKNTNDTETCLLYTQRKSTDALLHEMEKDRVDVGRSLFYNIYHNEETIPQIKKILFTEQFLYSEKFLFAGTTDFAFLDVNDYIVITDFKSANSPRDENIIAKYRTQVGAYAIAFEEIYKKPVHRGEIWISYPDGLQKIVVKDQELEKHKLEFIELTEQYHSMWDFAPFAEHVKLNF